MIKIITYHKSTNYGALLQALSLKEFIENEFNTAVTLDPYQPKKLFFYEFIRPMITRDIKKFFFTFVKNFKIILWYKRAFKIKNSKKISNLNIYGSDEIWNLKNAYHGYDPFFFGKNDNIKKISYSASFGISSFSDIKKRKKEIKKYLKNFNQISVRDENSAIIIKNILNIRPKILLDPVMIYTPRILNIKKYSTIKIRQKYAVVYGTVFSKEKIELINTFCIRKNYQLISIGYYNKWIKKNLIHLNPTNFYNIIKNADYVFTSMFHGVMFSVKLNKQFCYSNDVIRENKISTFLKILNLDNRRFYNFVPHDTINYKKLNIKVNALIQSSRNFLKKNIHALLSDN